MTAICAQCGVPFQPRSKVNKYCSTDCRWASRTQAPTGELQRSNRRNESRPTHFVVGDPQCKPGVPNDHMRWIGRYIAEKAQPNDVVINLGDHWDMPSLSMYDKGKKAAEGRRVKADIAAGDRGLDLLDEPLLDLQIRKVLLRGNHEDRISRACEMDASIDGFLSLDSLNTLDWEVHDFLEPVEIDGVVYSHYFYQPMTGKPYSGSIENRLKSIGHSFTMGHQQNLQYTLRFVNGQSQHALVLGATYQHDEDYKGPQGNAHWRGIAVCHHVENGSYDPKFVSLDSLCRRYEGHSLAQHKGREL